MSVEDRRFGGGTETTKSRCRHASQPRILLFAQHLAKQLDRLVLPENQPFQVALGLHHVLATGQAPALGEPVNVGINRKCGHPKRLRHHHACSLVAHSGQAFKRFHILGHFAVMLLQQDLTQSFYGF